MIGGCGLDQRDDLPPRQPRSTTTTGPRAAPTAGRTTRCSRTSSAPRTTSAAADQFHGVGGPLAVSDSRSMHPLVEAMLEAAVQAGSRAHPRPERRPPRGRLALPAQRSAAGCRCSTADAFLHPAARPAEPGGADAASSPSASCSRATARSASRSCSDGRARDGTGRARGDPLRRRLPVAGAADALRDRPRGGPRAVRDAACARTCRSAATCRTTAW